MSISRTQIEDWAKQVGLTVLGVTHLPASFALDMERLEAWQQEGRCADMKYMQRDPELLSSPLRLFEGAKSIVSFATFYDRGPHPKVVPQGHGRVARYAWGRDYHRVLKRAIEQFVALARLALSIPIEARTFTDAVPLLERAVARDAGGGFIGKNTMLIQPRGKGSFFFVSEVLWDVEVEPYETSALGGSCGSCTRCLNNCPTDALIKPYTLDARRCISYLTIEKRGMLNSWERRAIGEWIFGCDICQDVCPFNARAQSDSREADLVQLRASAGAGATLSIQKVLALRKDDDFVRQFAGTALMRTKRVGLLRNAAVVAANTLAESAIPSLMEACFDDKAPVVRAHALAALLQLLESGVTNRGAQVGPILDRARTDQDPCVQDVLGEWESGLIIGDNESSVASDEPRSFIKS